MKRVFLALLAVACGGKETNDVDADISDAHYDIIPHFGECCDSNRGGLGASCSALGLTDGAVFSRYEYDGGFAQQCASDSYCGYQLDPQPVGAACCGHDFPQNLVNGVYPGCSPWPGFIDHYWGDCCYTHVHTDAPHSGIGGIPGVCASDASLEHVQCAPTQYCGQDLLIDSGDDIRCCGDRDHPVNVSGMDPTCLPVTMQF